MPRAKPHSEQLAEIHRQLQQALELNDWQSMSSSSQTIRELLGVLPAEDELSPELRQLRQRLGGLHAEALSRCRLECERLREVLTSHAEHAEGRSAYMQIDGFLGGDV